MRKVIVAFLVFCAVVQSYSQVHDESTAAATDSTPNAHPATVSPGDELNPLDEDCNFGKTPAPNHKFLVVSWPIPDPKHISRFDRYGFCAAILHIPIDSEENVIARHDFLGIRIN